MDRARHDIPGKAERGELGPMPEATVAALADLGLNDVEIARYLRSDPATVACLRRMASKRADLPVVGRPPPHLRGGLRAWALAVRRRFPGFGGG